MIGPRYWKHTPTPVQADMLLAILSGDAISVLSGGAQGGGKTEGGIYCATMGLERRGWRALAVSPSLAQSDDLQMRYKAWLANELANGEIKFRGGNPPTLTSIFGGTIIFRVVKEHYGDEQVQAAIGGGYYNAIVVDEAGVMQPDALKHLGSRVGNSECVDPDAPNFIVFTANPGHNAHDFLRDEYVNAPQTPRSYYQPARVYDNPHASAARVANLEALTGEQRDHYLLGIFDTARAGALWGPELIRRARLSNAIAARECTIEDRWIGVDPAFSATGAECGIVVVGKVDWRERPDLIPDDEMYVVLADYSTSGDKDLWIPEIVRAATELNAYRVVVEDNHGKSFVTDAIRNAGLRRLNVRAVHSRYSKIERAQACRALYDSGIVLHNPGLAELETQMQAFTRQAINARRRSHKSDRVDALGYALGASSRRLRLMATITEGDDDLDEEAN